MRTWADTKGERAQEAPVCLSLVASAGCADGRSGQGGERGRSPSLRPRQLGHQSEGASPSGLS